MSLGLTVVQLLRGGFVVEAATLEKTYGERRSGECGRNRDPGGARPDYANIDFELEPVFELTKICEHRRSRHGDERTGLCLYTRQNPTVDHLDSAGGEVLRPQFGKARADGAAIKTVQARQQIRGSVGSAGVENPSKLPHASVSAKQAMESRRRGIRRKLHARSGKPHRRDSKRKDGATP